MAATLVAIALIGVIWAPYGFAMGGLIEEWDMRFLYASGRMGWTAFPGQPMSDLFAARPLTPVPFVLGYVMDPDSFIGMHILLIAALVAKVLVGAGVGWWLFRDRTLALCLGALVLVLPADSQQIALRNVHINLAVALMLVACLCMLQALYCRAPGRRRWLAGGGILAGLVGCLMYEPVLALYALPLMLIIARLGLRRALKLLRRRFHAALAWLGGAMASASYLFFAIVIQRSAYQTSLAGGDSGGIVKSVLTNAHALIDAAAYRFFVDGWRVAWSIAAVEAISPVYPIFAFVLALAALLILGGARGQAGPSLTLALRAYAAGILGLAAGYAPVLASVSHIAITQRTFLAATPGAAIACVALLALIGIVSRGAMTILASVAISLGLGMQVFQHDAYTRAYEDITAPFLNSVVQKTNPNKSVHLVIDNSGLGGFLGGVYFTKLKYGVPLLRAAYNDLYVLCKSLPLNVSLPFHTCRLDGDRWVVSSAAGAVETFHASDVDVIEMGQLSGVSLEVQSDHSAMPSFSPFHPARSPSERFECVADSMWGFSRFCPGEGWSDGATIRRGVRRISAFHAIASSPSLFIQMKPAHASYRLQILLAHPVPKEIAGVWGVELNGVAIPVNAVSATLFEARVAGSVLKTGANVLTVQKAQLAPDKPALAVRRLTLAPEGEEPVGRFATTTFFRPGVRYNIRDETLIAALVSGFSEPEVRGIWTDGSQAVLIFKTDVASGKASLELSVTPFLNESHSSMEVEAWIGNAPVANFDFNLANPHQRLRIPLPSDRLRNRESVEVRLLIRDPASPAAVGAGDRFLGLFLQEARIVRSP
jgi:hypothetical protein